MKARVANQSLADVMDQHTITGAPELCRAEGDRIRCLACGHRCLIGEGLRGICKVRFNDAGELKVPYGYVAGLQCDPVEKKPFFHVYPGSDALTFGMMGCDLHCSYCQNWITSQALRDTQAVAPIRPVTAGELVETACREQARLVVSSYNEPLITAEWAVSVFREARAAGLACAFVSNGNATPEVLDFLRPWIVAYKVDLKSFDDRNYRSLGGALDNILQTIRMVHERGLWLEVVTLIVPGFNDSDDELRKAARFLASVSPDIPWHVTAFHKDYRMTDPDATPPETLIRAAEIGTAEGLRFIYAGNLPGQVGPWEDTRCPHCQATVIQRFGYLIRAYHLTPEGRCPDCHTQLPGIWPGNSGEVRTGNTLAAYQGRLPRLVGVDRHAPGVRPLATVSSSQSKTHAAGARPLPVMETSPPPSSGGIKRMPGTESIARASHQPVNQRPSLTPPQKAQILGATAGMMRAAVAGQAAVFPNDAPEVGRLFIAGAFVSLKHGRHLRSCCGLLGQPVALGQALEIAVARTAWEDARFPPISPVELEHLEMEVWLLYDPEPVQARGEDRLQAITIGKHGIQVTRGQQQGLFLPSVAVDNHWDARRFLDQVCVKAGLAPTSWQEDATGLSIFEGESLRGRLLGPSEPSPEIRRPAPCQQEDLPVYGDFCRGNMKALLAGATPSYYLWNAPDGSVNGVILSLQLPGVADTYHFTQFSLRPGIPLQGTLFAVTQNAVQALAGQGLTPQAAETMTLGLTFLHDPAMHGTVADPHLGGLDPKHRAILVMERNKSAVLFNPEKQPEELLAEAARQARVTQPAAASVVSLDTITDTVPLSLSLVPRALQGSAVRPAAVAGTFYEADAGQLARTVDRLLEGEGERGAESWPAAMVPHAGLTYSGHIAAAVLRRLKIPRHIIVIGPKHTPQGVEWAVAPHQTWALPGARVASDPELARQLCDAIPGLELDALAHQREHAIEVELPLLARLAPDAKVVGIALGQADFDACRRFAEGLARVLKEREELPLLLISSDMNHFATDAENRRLDELALAALERRAPGELYRAVKKHNISMCGVVPAVIVLETLQLLGKLEKAERVAYGTTADVTGDKSRVVGYAGMLFG